MARIKLTLLVVSLLCCAAGTLLAKDGLDYARTSDAVHNVQRLVPIIDPSEIPGLHFGVPGALASLLWMRTSTQIGYEFNKDGFKSANLDVLAVQTLATARLDPFMEQPFDAAGAIMADVNFRLKIAHETLLTSLQGNSRNWRVYFWLGHMYYRNYGDAKTAAEWWKLTALMPGAPWYMANLAQFTMLQDTGKIDSLLSELSKGDQMWKMAKAEWTGIDEFSETQRVAKYDLRRFKHKFGRFPATTSEMVDSGLWRRVPTDPWGGSVGLSPTGDNITLSDQSPLFLQTFDDVVEPDPLLDTGHIDHWRSRLASDS